MKYDVEIKHSNGMTLAVNGLSFITDGSWKFDENNFHEFVMQKNSTYTFMGEDQILCISASDIQYVSIIKSES